MPRSGAMKTGNVVMIDEPVPKVTLPSPGWKAPWPNSAAWLSPIAARIATYDPPVGPAARAYVARHLADPAFRRWRAEGLIEESAHVNCDLDLPTRPWPHPG